MDSLDFIKKSTLIRLSVVIPTYNRQWLVQKAIDSFLYCHKGQFQLDIIVVDDGSTDQTEIILTDYIRLNKIKFLKIKNSERGFARNFGAFYSLKYLNPDYFIFFDADDIITSEALIHFYEALSHSPEISVFFARYQLLNSNETRGKISRIQKNDTDIKQLMIFSEPVLPLGCTLLKASVFQEVGGFSEDRNLSGSEDWLFLFKIILRYKAKALDFISTLYRQHESNTNSKQFDRSLNLCVRVVEEHAKEWGLEKNEVLAIKKQFLYSQIGAHNSDPFGQPIDHLKKLIRLYPSELLHFKFYKYFLSILKNKLKKPTKDPNLSLDRI